MRPLPTKPLAAVSSAMLLSLAACSGGGDFVSYVGGDVSGLTAGQSVVLENNGRDALSVSSNGRFVFRDRLLIGDEYRVTIRNQPSAQVCQLSNAIGRVNDRSDDVTSVKLVCVNLPALTGTVSGLNAGGTVTLSNAGVQLPVSSNGSFAFPGVLAIGANYLVTVASNPVGQTCSVTNGAGSTTNSVTPPTSVTVTCR